MGEKKVSATEEEMRAMIAEAASSLPDCSLLFDKQKRPLPPWLVFQDYDRSSMGWRMGGGEDYWVEFSNWYRGQSAQSRADYRAAYSAPEGWEDYYDMLTSK